MLSVSEFKFSFSLEMLLNLLKTIKCTNKTTKISDKKKQMQKIILKKQYLCLKSLHN